MKIYVMRHGRTVWNEKGIIQGFSKNRLSAFGKQQVEEVAQRLAVVKIDAIFSSPLVRTMQTANIISKKLHVKVLKDERIIERNKGVLAGRLKKTQTEEELKLREQNPHALGMESEQEIYVRVLDFMKMLKEKFPNKTILIVSHGRVTQMVEYVCKFSGWDEKKFWSIQNFENAEIREFEY